MIKRLPEKSNLLFYILRVNKDCRIIIYCHVHCVQYITAGLMMHYS